LFYLITFSFYNFKVYIVNWKAGLIGHKLPNKHIPALNIKDQIIIILLFLSVPTQIIIISDEL